LREDLKFILDNKDKAFAETNNIFEIYFLEKDEKGSTVKLDNSIRESSTSMNFGNKNQSIDSHNS